MTHPTDHHSRRTPTPLRALTLGLLALALFGPGGCVDPGVAPRRDLLPEGPPYTYSDADWARVLRHHVRLGLVDYEALSQEPEPLLRYAALLSVTGPTKTPQQFASDAEITAYWVNAFNACVLSAVLSRYPVTTMYDLSLPRLEYDVSFVVDGDRRTLSWIEDRMLEQSHGDGRTLLATSRAAMGTPPLPQEPFHGDTLDSQLDAAAAEALRRLVRVDHVSRAVYVWQEILTRQDAFIEFWKQRRRVPNAHLFTVLAELGPPELRTTLQRAAGYEVRQLPFDRALNRIAPRRP